MKILADGMKQKYTNHPCYNDTLYDICNLIYTHACFLKIKP